MKFGTLIDIRKEKLPFIINGEVVKKHLQSLLRNGDIIIADAAEDETVGKCCEVCCLEDEKVLAGLHTIPVRTKEKFALGYLGYYMNSDSYHDQLLPIIQGTKVSSISKASIKNTIIKYPKFEIEQNLIGLYLKNIDCLITLYQR